MQQVDAQAHTRESLQANMRTLADVANAVATDDDLAAKFLQAWQEGSGDAIKSLFPNHALEVYENMRPPVGKHVCFFDPSTRSLVCGEVDA